MWYTCRHSTHTHTIKKYLAMVVYTLITALRKQGHADLCGFEMSLIYIASSGLARLHIEMLSRMNKLIQK